MDTGFLEGKGLGARGMLISDCGMRNAECGEWRVESGEWRVESETGRNKGGQKKGG
jgi:hypothetical protein